ncbi:uncharacterized protein LOC125652571 isoform X2 [Ostrea edulis]|nr:uncharacterized protein LOC125652571 isoform X2 [Ostrea edulis]
MIKSISQSGFVLQNDNIRIIGPTVFFPREVLHWNIKSVEDIHEASLSMFTLLEPKVDILLIGVGSHMERISSVALKYLRVNQINFEVLPTEKACALFNFLNEEKRQVVAAMIPPPVINQNLVLPKDDDLITFNPSAIELDSGVLPTEMPSFSDIMLPGHRLKETATNVRELLDRKRSKAGVVVDKDLETLKDNDKPQEMQATFNRIMDEVDEEMAVERGKSVKEITEKEAERDDKQQTKPSSAREKARSAEARINAIKISKDMESIMSDKLKTDKDSDDPKS